MEVHSSVLVCSPAELRLNLNYRCRDCLLLPPPPQSQGCISWLLLQFYSVEEELQWSTLYPRTPKKYTVSLTIQTLYVTIVLLYFFVLL